MTDHDRNDTDVEFADDRKRLLSPESKRALLRSWKRAKAAGKLQHVPLKVATAEILIAASMENK